MDIGKAHLVEKSQKSYRVARPKQTGFSSPATHYTEPRIDLNNALIHNPASTFYIRVVSDSFSNLQIQKEDVLIIDKSLVPKQNQLVVVMHEGEFQITRINRKSSSKLQIWGVITYIIKNTL